MRIVLIGSVDFSLKALSQLILLNADVVGVCTLKESKFNTDHVDLTPYCKEHGIPSLYVHDINSNQTLNWIRDKSPDIIFCFGWSRLIKQELLLLAPYGVIGFHPAALPANRGRHPIIWALVLGLRKTASTFFYMDEGIDSGAILSQAEVLISEDDDAASLYEKVVLVAMQQIRDFLPTLAYGPVCSVKQDLTASNIWRKRGYGDGQIDWRMSARSIYNLVRGLSSPYPGAHFLLGGKEIKVWKVKMVFGVPENYEPGRVVMKTKQQIVIKCGEDAIALLRTQPDLSEDIGDYL